MGFKRTAYAFIGTIYAFSAKIGDVCKFKLQINLL